MKRILLCLGILVGLVACDFPEAHHDSVIAIQQAFPDYEQAKAIRVANCESNLIYTAHTSGYSVWGLFQIHQLWAGTWQQVTGQNFWSTWNDPYWNAQFAAYIWRTYGWSMWADICANA